jgi:hypothetical protein
MDLAWQEILRDRDSIRTDFDSPGLGPLRTCPKTSPDPLSQHCATAFLARVNVGWHTCILLPAPRTCDVFQAGILCVGLPMGFPPGLLACSSNIRDTGRARLIRKTVNARVEPIFPQLFTLH